MTYCYDKLALKVLTRIFLLPLMFLLAAPADAQTGTVVGGESFGAECFRASHVAVSTGSANRVDLESCDRAILDGGLKRKDLIASYVNRGVIHMAMRNTKQAMADLNLALEMDSNTGEAYINRGNLWFFGNNLANAVADYDLALELGVEKPHVAHLNRGMAHEQLGRLKQAKSDYQASLNYVKGWPAAEARLKRVKEKINQKRTNKK